MKRKLLVNTLVSGGHTAVVGLVGLVLLPYMLAKLGVLELGLLGIINIFAMSGYIGLFEMGLQSSIAKYASQFAAKTSYDKVAVLLNSTLVVFLVIGVALAIAGVLLADVLSSRVFRIPREHHASFAFALSLVFSSYVFLFPNIAIQGLLEGLQRFSALKSIQVVIVLANAVGTVLLLSRGYRYLAVVMLMVALQLVQFLALSAYALSAVPSLRLSVRLFSVESLGEIRRMSGMIFIGRISSLVFSNTDRILVGALLGGVAMGFYDIVIRIPRMLKLVLGFINVAVMPAVSELVARGRHDAVQRLFLLGTNIHMIVTYPIVTAIMFYAEPLLSVWIGPQYAHLASMLRWALGYNLLVALIGIGGSIIVGSNIALRSFTAVSVLSSLVNVALTLAFIRTRGLEGVFIATVVASALMLPLYLRSFLRVAPVGQLAFWMQVLRAVVAGLVPLGTAILLRRWFWPANPVELIAMIGAWAALYWVSLYAFVSGRDEREAMRTILFLFLRPARQEPQAG